MLFLMLLGQSILVIVKLFGAVAFTNATKIDYHI
jgi:hypothetical protein